LNDIGSIQHCAKDRDVAIKTLNWLNQQAQVVFWSWQLKSLPKPLLYKIVA